METHLWCARATAVGFDKLLELFAERSICFSCHPHARTKLLSSASTALEIQQAAQACGVDASMNLWIVRRSFFPIPRFFGRVVVDVQRRDREGLLAITAS